MSASKIPSEDEERILVALRNNPELRDCVLEMLDIAQDPIRDKKLELGDATERSCCRSYSKNRNKNFRRMGAETKRTGSRRSKH